MFIKNFVHNKRGQSLVELLMTMGLAAMLMPAFLVGFSTTRQGRAQQSQRIQAIAYMRETAEAMRIIRDNGWSNIATNGTYCVQPSGTTWQLVSPLPTPATTCNQPVTGLTRTVTIADVYRVTATNAIDPFGTSTTLTDYDDSSSKAVTITVSWNQPVNSSSVSEVLYFTRHDNLTAIDTTTSDFTSGLTGSTGVITESGGLYGDGAVVLGGGGASDWCKPNGPAIIKHQTSNNANEVAISAVSSPASGTPSYAYTTFGYSANGDTLDQWNVSDPTPAPGSPTVAPGLAYNPTPQEKSYGVFGTTNAIFIGSNKNKVTVDIINPSTFNEISTFQDSGGEAGESIYAESYSGGLEGFVTACTLSGTSCSGSYKLYSFDYHTAPFTTSTTRTQDGVIGLTAEGRRVVVVNNIAFVATASTTNQMQVFDVSDPKNLKQITVTLKKPDGTTTSIGAYQNTSQGAKDITVDNTGNYAYLVTSNSGSDTDIFKIDLSNIKTGITSANATIVATATTGAMSPTGVILVSQNHLVVVGSGGSQYQVMFTDLSACPSGQGLLSLGSGIVAKAVAAVSEADGDNYAYVLTSDPNNELQIIPGGEGSGGGGGGGTGTFISRGLPVPNLTTNATFNSFFPIADAPAPTSITYQVGVAPTCSSSFTFVGPGGSTSTTYATSSAIPLTGTAGYQNPGGCIKYKAILKSGGSTTSSPILYQVSVNYSP